MEKDKVIILAILCLVVGFVTGAATGIRFGARQLRVSEGVTAPPSTLSESGKDSGQETAALERALREDPGDLGSLIALGNRYFDGGQPEKAIAMYARALRIDPRNPDVRTDMAIMYRSLKEYDRAVKELREAAAQDGGHANSRYNLGIVLLYDKKDVRGAVAAWEDCLKAGASAEQAAAIRRRLKELKELSE